MKIEFDITIWRGFYDQIAALGQYLKDCYPDWEGNPPKFNVNKEEKDKIQRKIDLLMHASDSYLDRCNLRPKEPKWNYNRNDQTTWASSEEFKYKHLMPNPQYITVTFKG